MIEDRILVWRFNRGDPGGMCRIYEKHRVCLARVAAALLADSSLVEDVVHDVFVSFAETAGRFELKGSLKGYLSICVANRARDVNRAGRRHDMVDIAETELSANHSSPETEAMQRETGRGLDDALANLPDEQREAVVLHLLGELPFRQIAALRETSVNTVMSRYRYGLEKLRATVEGRNGHV